MTDEEAKEALKRRIRERAYRIWLDEGQPQGRDLKHWLLAKREVEEEAGIINGTEDLTMDNPRTM